MDKPIDVDDLRDLPYLEMCLKESLRRSACAVWIYAREAQTDLRLGDYFFRRGRFSRSAHWRPGRNAKYFDNPARVPTRALDS